MKKLRVVLALLVLALSCSHAFAETDAAAPGEARGVCMANLKQMGLAMQMYAQDYNEQFPDDPKILFSKHYISTLEILICPAHKSLNSDSSISYVYVRGLTAKDRPNGILMYDASTDNHEGQGRNVLFLDGHVRYCVEKDFQELLAKFLAEYREKVELTAVEIPRSVEKLADEFQKTYVLSSGQALKHINPPLRPEGGANVMCYHWDEEGLIRWSQGYGNITIASILNSLAGIHPNETEGDKELLNTQVKGDFILRTGTPQETIVNRLEEILQKDLNISVQLTFRELEKDVIKVTGYLKTNLLSKIEFYDTKRGGGGAGKFQELMTAIGDYIGCPVVSEVINPPVHIFSWSYNKSKDLADRDSMLQNLSDQTGLTFKEDKRKVRMLFVEK